VLHWPPGQPLPAPGAALGVTWAPECAVVVRD
jgi:hypothetical protein